MLLRLPPVPLHEDSYRWIYADVSSGDTSAVFIFMVGSVFSRRYATSDSRPTMHSAVNLAVYDKHKTLAWVLTEHQRVDATPTRWRIGRSAVELLPDGTIHAQVDERTKLGARVRAELRLQPTAPPLRPRALAENTTHTWQPLAPRARAILSFQGAELAGAGYLDTNAGGTKLGTDLARWTWSRVHGPELTEIRYEVEGGLRTLLRVRDSSVEELVAEDPPPSRRNFWGLSVPANVRLGDGGLLDAGPLVESSPFYARQHSRAGNVFVLSESADFARFRAWYVRWMADFRTRYERAA